MIRMHEGHVTGIGRADFEHFAVAGTGYCPPIDQTPGDFSRVIIWPDALRFCSSRTTTRPPRDGSG
jgi:hypothetical protein